MELIEEYYEIAPSIVRAMKESPNYGELCEELLDRYIRPCLALINQGRNEECKRLYMEMVRYAEGLVSAAAILRKSARCTFMTCAPAPRRTSSISWA